MKTRNRYATQGRCLIEELRKRPLTYRQMLNCGHGNSPWKRVAESLRPGESISKGVHEPSGCITWRIVGPRNA
ncbi:MAG: hypothetical protein RL030_1761 [Pseudomonadota bacterium]